MQYHCKVKQLFRCISILPRALTDDRHMAPKTLFLVSMGTILTSAVKACQNTLYATFKGLGNVNRCANDIETKNKTKNVP